LSINLLKQVLICDKLKVAKLLATFLFALQGVFLQYVIFKKSGVIINEQ